MGGASLIRAPEVSSLLSLIMNWLVWAGLFMGLGDSQRGVPWRSSPGCIQNHCEEGCRSQDPTLNPSPDCVIAQILDKHALVFSGLGASRPLGGITWHRDINPKDKHNNTTCIFPALNSASPILLQGLRPTR